MFVLRELTRAFPELTVAVEDGDGAFLLIEAARALPAWLEPDTSANRVFVRGGALHLVDVGLAPSSPSLTQASAASAAAALFGGPPVPRS